MLLFYDHFIMINCITNILFLCTQFYPFNIRFLFSLVHFTACVLSFKACIINFYSFCSLVKHFELHFMI